MLLLRWWPKARALGGPLDGLLLRLRASPGEPSRPVQPPAPDPAFKRLLMYLFVGSRGGQNRLRMVRLLKEEPMNAHKISERLALDYKTVQHHLKLMESNEIVTSSPKGSYGAVVFVTPYMERHMPLAEEMWVRFGQS